ncbi:MAG: anaerobic ribonucleoside-triphosphate reductase [Spirochaetes bacterium]|nr:anaerobic ribonucleoside-triphosphate reductase [Spirochaetota bacterium]
MEISFEEKVSVQKGSAPGGVIKEESYGVNSEHGFTGFVKRDGTIVDFDPAKISGAIRKASEKIKRGLQKAIDIPDPDEVTGRVISELNDPASPYFVLEMDGKRLPEIEDVQDLVEIVLAQTGYHDVMTAYKLYRKKRENIRKQLKIRTRLDSGRTDSTDALLLVESTTQNVTHPWDKSRIVEALQKETSLSYEESRSIAKSVENRAFAWNDSTISTALVREMVNNELEERGHIECLRDMAQFSIAKPILEGLLFSKSDENSNIKNNNPEAVTQTIGEIVLKQYALRFLFGDKLERAHATGRIHIHDLGFPDRVYCSSHSIEYIKKYGLKGLVNLTSESSPAKSAQVLTGHLNTYLASMQAYYAGALGVAYINILYAPLLEGLSEKEIYQRAQELIFNGSQNAFSRGGQSIFLDFNIHAGVPEYLKKVPAIGPGGRYMLMNADGGKVGLEEFTSDELSSGDYRLMVLKHGGRVVLREILKNDGQIEYDTSVQQELEANGEKIVTYGDYEKLAGDFALKMLDVWEKGDTNGRVFEFPKCDFHVSEESFSDPEQLKILDRACEVASRNGSVYFIFDRDQVTLSACCRLRTTINDNYMLMHPESMRFCGFQNVTINIPHAAYLAAEDGQKNTDGLLEKIYESMDLAIEAHLLKKNFVEEKMMKEGGPLWQIGKQCCDGKRYVDLDKSTYIVGLIGVNDAVKFLTGKEMHESEESVELAIKIVAAMNVKLREYTERYGLKFTLEESPAESAARRLAKTDMIYFEKYATDIVKGSFDDDSIYYTNSIHLSADCNVSIVERIRVQGLFHGLIESGAITHAFVGEERPSSGAIFKLVRNTFFRTQSAQLTISPEFTYCNDCHNEMRGLIEKCDRCGSSNVDGISRIVGYYSVIHDWNKSKKGELRSRKEGNYALANRDGISESGNSIMPSYKKSSVSMNHEDIIGRNVNGLEEARASYGKSGSCENGVCTLY